MKYAKDMPEKTRPASAPKDQNAILSSPSGFFAFFTAKTRHKAATMSPIAVSVPKSMRSRLSGRAGSLLQFWLHDFPDKQDRPGVVFANDEYKRTIDSHHKGFPSNTCCADPH
jgi:hypothetical protein